MDEHLDMDDLLERLAPDVYDVSLDVMPCPRYPPVHDVRIMPVSRKVVLDEVLKGLPAMGPVFDTYMGYGGLFSDVRAFVFDPVTPVKLHEVFTSSGMEFNTVEKAEERAAEAMIRKLEREYKFETKDLNWENMRRFNNDSYNSCIGWRRAEEENQVLRMKVDALTKGWRRSLERST